MVRLCFLLSGGFYGGLAAHYFFAAPMLNLGAGEGSIGYAMWFGLFGWKFFAAYDVAGVMVGALVGLLLTIPCDQLLVQLEDRFIHCRQLDNTRRVLAARRDLVPKELRRFDDPLDRSDSTP